MAKSATYIVMRLADYDMTPERGFLTPHDMDRVELPPDFATIESVARHLSGWLTADHVRPVLDTLPEIDMAGHLPVLSDAQRRLLMVRYSFLVQAYVWGSDQPPAYLPRNLAVPYCDLAEATGQYPLLPYSGYTLDNWAKIDAHGDVTLDNIYVLQNFLGGMDENWFILVHVEIEAKAGPALAAMPAILDAAEAGDSARVKDGLAQIRDAWARINPVFDRMPERCDPYIYYNRVRPYIHGWAGNPAMPGGLVYEGVEKFGGRPQAFRGQTGAQSSIVPAMDALLGIEHESDPLREFLDELHNYRPPGHRRFIEDVAARSQVRRLVEEDNDDELRNLYDSCLDHIQAFRTRHLEFAAEYINKQAGTDPANPTDVGTGGTPFMTYLKKHRDESRRVMQARYSRIGKRVGA